MIHGGSQENALRAGTENVPGIAGLGKAAELAMHGLQHTEQLLRHRDRLEHGIKQLAPNARVNGHPEHRLPNTLNMTLPNLRGESLVVAMDQLGVSLSSGSACKAGSPDPTHVLIAMGSSDEDAHCSIRLSLSHYTTAADVDAAIASLKTVLEDMETTVRFLSCK